MGIRKPPVLLAGISAGSVLIALFGARMASQPVQAGTTRVSVTWHSCQNGGDDELGTSLDQAGAQCAQLKVPLDYQHPNRGTITLSMSRLKATNPAKRRGALLLNPGGPGDPAMGLVIGVAQAQPELAASYDLIGPDPRFVGRSTPLSCIWDIDTTMLSAGGTRRTFDQAVSLARAQAAGCTGGNQRYLPYANTRNTARDLDQIRTALGEQRISYVGWSYGTYLGAVYLQLFPDRADRFVLDSAVDPTAYGPNLLRGVGTATTAALGNWANWAATHDTTYHLGTTASAVLGTVNHTYQASVRAGLRVGNYQVDSRVLPYLLFIPIRFDTDDYYAEMAAEVRILADAAAGSTVSPTDTMAQLLAGIYDHPGQSTSGEGTPILCGDATSSRDPETYYQDIQAHRADERLFGPLTRNVNPCAFWSTTPVEPLTRIQNHVPALIIGATGDPRTPYPGQQSMHRALAGSRMVTLQGAFRHLVYLMEDNSCVTSAATGYLLGGELPAADITCSRETS